MNHQYFSLISPHSRKKLALSADSIHYTTDDGMESYPLKDNVVSFLGHDDEFYEGAYHNRIYFNPKSESIFNAFPLFFINGGYLWNVRKHFPKDSDLLELGCASGVDYFGTRYNMVGLDLSRSSLKGLCNYRIGIQAEATSLPFEDNSFDGILSSYFWEHIDPQTKDKMLNEFLRVLRPSGKILFLYDVETKNSLIELLKVRDYSKYQRLFLEGDGHLGYETPDKNSSRFEDAGFTVVKHFGMEKSWFQSNSVFEKLRSVTGWVGTVGRIGYYLTKGKFLGLVSLVFIRAFDETIGRLLPLNNARIILTVAEKNHDSKISGPE